MSHHLHLFLRIKCLLLAKFCAKDWGCVTRAHSLWSHETVSLAGKTDNNNYKTLISSVKRTRLRVTAETSNSCQRRLSRGTVFKLRPEAKKVVIVNVGGSVQANEAFGEKV